MTPPLFSSNLANATQFSIYARELNKIVAQLLRRAVVVSQKHPVHDFLQWVTGIKKSKETETPLSVFFGGGEKGIYFSKKLETHLLLNMGLVCVSVCVCVCVCVCVWIKV